MTGYGRGTSGNKNISVDAEIKSVNSRYLDLFFKLPSSLQSKEYELREILKSKIKRGKITTFISMKMNEKETGIPIINKEKLKASLNFLKDLKKTARINDKIKIEHILSFKEFFLPDELEFGEKEFSLVKDALDDAVIELLKMKKNEGGELFKDLIGRIKNIDEKVQAIENESSKSVGEYFSLIKDKIKTLVEDITQYNDRLEMELALIAERSDITEECVRLRSHLKFFLESLERDEDPGRKVNFICQEMNREANTISSKSLSTEITRNAVMIKEEIERIREQIQNIE
jgi:uncharacterized protein (TIGR00255 family)